MLMRFHLSALVLFPTFFSPAHALEKSPEVTTDVIPQPEGVADLEIVAMVVAMKGSVRVRQAQDEPWQPTTVGMLLHEGAELRTSLRSYVRFKVLPDQVVLMDRLGSIKLLAAIVDAKNRKARTDLGMKYGRLRYDVKPAGYEIESTVYSPNATLAVQGTDAMIEDGYGFPASVSSVRGRILATFSGCKAVQMGSPIKASIDATRAVPASKARGDTVVDPRTAFAARTPDEAETIEQFPGTGGGDSQIVFRPHRLFGESPEFPPLPFTKTLFFLLEWAGVDEQTDLDLAVVSPVAEDGVLTSTNTPVPSGGTHNGQGITGNISAGHGKEEGFWQHWPPVLVIPSGQFVASGTIVSEDQASDVTLEIHVDGKLVNTCGPTALDPANQTIQCDVDIQ